MIEICKNECIGCGACEAACPYGYITLINDNEGFKYPVTNIKKCVGCGACNRVCPANKSTETILNEHLIFGAYNNNHNIVNKSSSGGIFSLLLEDFFSKNPNGVAYGAVLDKNLFVKHQAIHQYGDVNLLRGSKYVQSDLQGIYLEISQLLKHGEAVYFSGTPCQVAGLKSYLQKDYNNLFTQAVLCHGVTSPLIWEKYVKLVETEEGGVKISNINFRDKTYGWENYSMALVFEDGSSIIEESKNNLFLKAYGANISLRPACYSCKFKFPNYSADVTLGDFWNVKTICPSVYNPQGVSLLFVSSERGQKTVERIQKSLTIKKITIEDAINSQKGIVKNVPRNNKRDIFFKYIECENLRDLIERLIKNSVYKKVRISLGKLYKTIICALKTRSKEKISGQGRNYYNTRL